MGVVVDDVVAVVAVVAVDVVVVVVVVVIRQGCSSLLSAARWGEENDYFPAQGFRALCCRALIARQGSAVKQPKHAKT